ncbi:MAG: DNA repair protein RecN, partial [Mycobacterium sp.]
LDPAIAVRVGEILASSGADRDDDGSIIALRTVSRDGPSRAYLGGRSVPAKSLSALTTGLLTLHGQNDQLRLMWPEEQRAALDRFAGVADVLERYRKLRDEWLIARWDLDDRTSRAREVAQEADRLKFALAEIDRVDPKPAEDDVLVADIRRLSELDSVREAAAGAREALSGSDDDESGSATAQLARAAALLESTDDATLTALGHQLHEALGAAGDVARELGDYLAGLPADASTLETKLARQAELRSLTRKYAAVVDGVLAWAAESRQRLAQLDVSEEALVGLARRVDELAGKVAAAAVKLSKARAAAATGLATAVTGELSGLAMADADFTVTVATMEAYEDDGAPLTLPSGEIAHAGSDGVDAIEFGFTAQRQTDGGGTPGSTSVLPLSKSASGGELSRVMLALEVVLAASAEGTTMVFDEVDAGVGGRAAVQIGKRLARLARTHQVIVVTHLPQVAAYADTHLVVEGGSGASRVRSLDDDDRVVELARMLAGLGESDTARAHARELLESARQER